MFNKKKKKTVYEVRAVGYDDIMGKNFEFGQYVPAYSISDAWNEFRKNRTNITFIYLQINEVKHFERSEGISGTHQVV